MPDTAAENPTPGARDKFPRRMRLSGALLFAGLRRSPVRKTIGPLTVFGKPNDLPHPRLGLSVARAVGTAARRARIKRLIRESFRLLQRELPAGYDLLVSVRRHDPMPLQQYQDTLLKCAQSIQRAWTTRRRPSADERRAPESRR